MLKLIHLGRKSLLMVTKREEEGIFYWKVNWDTIGIVTNDFKTLGKIIVGVQDKSNSGPPLKRLWIDNYGILCGEDIEIPSTEIARKFLEEVGMEIRKETRKHYIL